MNTVTKQDGDDAFVRGQAEFLQHLHGGLTGVALRCALQLNIAGIISRHDGRPVTLSQIAQGITSQSLDVNGLSRLMRFLVRKQIFNDHQPADSGGQPLYSLNHCSKLLLSDTRETLAPLAIMFTDPLLFSALYSLNQTILEGGTTMMNTFGQELWGFLSGKPALNRIFNDAMGCSTRIAVDAVMSNYGFDRLEGSLVDVGGGIGVALNDIVTAYPHIRGINFDLPHVISTAPVYQGVTHVGGDMFTSVPLGHSFFLKSILHNWSDDKCVEILKNCRESMIGKSGKVIIVDIILNPKGDDVFDDARIDYDLIMLACFGGGKERTQVEWKHLLEEAGFLRYNVIKIPAVMSIIEAFQN